jgi:hypothetical protein
MEQRPIRDPHFLSESGRYGSFEIGPTWNLYVAFCSIAALPALTAFMHSWEGKLPFLDAYRYLSFPLLALLYLRSRVVRLDREGASQGFPILGTAIRYEDVESFHREIRSGKGTSTPILVITKRDSRRRIVIYIRSVDDNTLRQFVLLLKQKAPQLFVDDLILTPFATALER